MSKIKKKSFKFFVHFCLLFLSNILFSQNQVDSISYYCQKGNFTKAIKFGELVEKQSLNNKSYLLSIKANLGVCNYLIGNWNQAKIKFNEAFELANEEKNFSEVELAVIKKQASKNLKELREFDEASDLIKEAIAVFKSNLKENYPNYADALRSLGDIYKSEGEIEKAIPLLKESSEIFGEIFGENEYYASSINSLGYCYFLMEDYNNAELLITKSLKILEENKIKNSSDYALGLSNLADVFIIKKQYEKAENVLIEACEILKKEGANNPKYIQTLSKLGYLYLAAKNYDDAEIVLKKSVELNEIFYGANHPNTKANKNNLALVYYDQNKLESSKNIYLDILNEDKKDKNIYIMSNIMTLNNLALLYVKLKKIDEAEKIYLAILKMAQKKNTSQTAKELIFLENISLMYFQIEKDNLAEKYITKQLKIVKNLVSKFALFFSENEITNYINLESKSIIFPYSFLQKYSTQYPEINIGCYENELLVKNLSLRNQQHIKTSIEKSGNILLQEKYQQFIANKRHLTKLEELPIDKRPTNYEQLITTTETLEKELVRQSTAFADAKKSLTINWKQIQENLKPNEIAIDLVAYNYYNKKWTDSIVYAAFVVKKDSKFPKYVPLFEEKQLEFLLAKNKNEKDHNRIDTQYSDKAISDLFLKPLEKEFNGCSTIYLSPSGLAHQINFKALPISENQTFGEQFNVKLVGSSASIVDYKTTAFQENKNLEIILYGGIDYAKSSVTTPTNEENKVAIRSDFEGGFGYIKGTLAEINSIANQVKTNKNTAILKTERNATEESIKQLDGKIEPFVLHLATHGYFFPDPKQELPKEDLLSDSKFKMYKTADDPMMRSGLLFAGANKYWGKPTENLTSDDGILTASEISNLDLSACQLVVMSACETGLGQINGSEGVFGLQRAFKMAGVKNIIMSLWKVPDAQTAELFDIFYTECFNGKSIQEAFQTAQTKMKVKYSPYYWAGFVLLE